MASARPPSETSSAQSQTRRPDVAKKRAPPQSGAGATGPPPSSDPEAGSTSSATTGGDQTAFSSPNNNPESAPTSSSAPDPITFLIGAANDRPPIENHLGFSAYATAFADLIASPSTTPPLTIGIFGSWGAGKSTLLDAIEREIEVRGGGSPPSAENPIRPPFVHVVRFNAWDYNTDEMIWPALARVTMETIVKQLPGNHFSRFLSVFSRNLTRTWRGSRGLIVITGLVLVAAAVVALTALNLSAAAVFGAVAAVGVGGLLKEVNDTVNNPISKWLASLFQGPNYGERESYMQASKDDLKWLEDRLVRRSAPTAAQTADSATTDRRVLVIIDDLDRCEPDKVVEVLQAINRLLDLESFIVCLGVDARIAIAAIEQHYGDTLKAADASGFEYLDKIVQIPFRIPEPSDTELGEFLNTQLPTQLGIPPTNGNQPPPPSRPLGELVPFTAMEVQAFQSLSMFLRPNPRHVKRLINVYRLVRSLAEARAGAGDVDASIVLGNPDATIRWLTISAQWPYTAQAILAKGERLESENESIADPALQALYHRVRPELSDESRRAFDGDSDRLDALVAGSSISWPQLRAIRRYTINFNPAVEHRLRLDEAQKVVAAGPANQQD